MIGKALGYYQISGQLGQGDGLRAGKAIGSLRWNGEYYRDDHTALTSEGCTVGTLHEMVAGVGPVRWTGPTRGSTIT